MNTTIIGKGEVGKKVKLRTVQNWTTRNISRYKVSHGNQREIVLSLKQNLKVNNPGLSCGDEAVTVVGACIKEFVQVKPKDQRPK